MVPGLALAKEITTNGTGGGPWSDPATWRGQAVPAAADDVVIQKGDAVVFDRNDDGKVTCQKLFLDPKGALVFKGRAGKQVCCVADEVESYGTIKLDGTGAATDFLELRLVGDTAAKRTVKLLKGAALLVYGRKNLADDGRNVALTAPNPGEKKEELPGTVEAGGGAMLDVQRARVANVFLKAAKIDNTGARANERLNVLDNHFTGQGRVLLSECDTPVVARNTFRYEGAKPLPLVGAVQVGVCQLPEIKDNTVRGGFQYGITVTHSTDPTVAGNTIEKCAMAFHLAYTQNGMVKRLTIRECEAGVDLFYCSAIVEEVVVDGAKTALRNYYSTSQFTSCRVENVPKKDGVALLFEHGATTLLNCNIPAAKIKVVAITAKTATSPPAPVAALEYLVVGVKGAPAGAQVEVSTSKPVPPLPKGAADPNVRNSPATISRELTPLPQTLSPLIVASWSIDYAGKPVPAPEYTVKVLGPAAKEGAPRPVLKMVTVKPADNWFRPKPNAVTPTVEVTLK